MQPTRSSHAAPDVSRDGPSTATSETHGPATGLEKPERFAEHRVLAGREVDDAVRSPYAFLLIFLIFGTNARNRRGLSSMIRRSTSSLAPAALSFGTNTVKVFAYPRSLLLRLS
jgi:hypothetical protein